MSFLIKEYEVPFLGKIELLDANGGYTESFNGKYYARNENMGIFCEKCKSEEELIEKVGLKIKECIKYRIEESENRIISEKKNKKSLEAVFKKMKIKEGDFQNGNGWLKQYQTDNPFQLEIQRAEKQKQKESMK